MSKISIISENPNSTVISEYKEESKRSTFYQSEAELEKEFMNILIDQKYEYLDITNEKDLIINLRNQLEKLNNYVFTDNEWDNFLINLLRITTKEF